MAALDTATISSMNRRSGVIRSTLADPRFVSSHLGGLTMATDTHLRNRAPLTQQRASVRRLIDTSAAFNMLLSETGE